MNTANFDFDVVIAAIIGFVIGALLVGIITYTNRKKTKEEDNSALKELHALQKKYDRYRARVNEHFAKTADSIDSLTKSYQQVFEHLSHGAQNLMDKESLQAQLEKRQNKAVTLAYLVEQEHTRQSEKKASTVTAKTGNVSTQKQSSHSAMGDKTQHSQQTTKSNVHIAAEKAGLKPVGSTTSRHEPKIIQDDEYETAIDAVKKHIKQEADKGSTK